MLDGRPESQIAQDEDASLSFAGPPATPRHRWYLPLKTTIEWLGAVVLMVPTIPLLAVLAILVRLTSRGPAFYSQERMGKDGRVFRMYKLRSMRHGCEAETGPIWSPPNDMRVTRLGRYMRRTHLDELPQLFNVVLGQMSLIGPRPERPQLVAQIEKSIPQFRQRLVVRPGLTGLAQTQQPADTGLHTVRRKLAYDLYYIRQVNPWLDLRIALSTGLYLVGVVMHSMGRRVVSSYGVAAERDVTTEELMRDPECESPAA